MFAFQRRTAVISESYGARPGRMNVNLRGTQEQLLKIDGCAAECRCQSRMEFASAAIIWFNQLDRYAQIEFIAANVVEHKPRHWPFSVPMSIGKVVRSWSFPIHSMGHVLTSAMLAFGEMPQELKADYVKKALVLLSE